MIRNAVKEDIQRIIELLHQVNMVHLSQHGYASAENDDGDNPDIKGHHDSLIIS